MVRGQEYIFKDSLLQLSEEMSSETEQFFTIDDTKIIRPLRKDSGQTFMIRYEMHPDLRQGERTVYTVLDFLGDVGGFADALKAMAVFILFLTQFSPINVYLVSKLYDFTAQ